MKKTLISKLLTRHFRLSATLVLSAVAIGVLVSSECWADLLPVEAGAGTSFSVLPASNQWVFDRAKTFIFVSMTRANLFDPVIDLSHFELDFADSNYLVPKLIADLKLRDFDRFSLGARYELGFIHRSAQMISLTSNASLTAESADLIAIPIGVGLLTKYSINDSLFPFLGYQVDETFYRLSSSLSGADSQGALFTHGPIIGLTMLLPNPDWKLSALVSYERVFASSSSLSSKSGGDDLTAGLGWYF